MNLPLIGQGSTFGGKKYGDNHAVKLRILEEGFDRGINLVDTGEYYEGGVAERIVGSFIRNKRDRVIVSDKFKASNNSYGNVFKSCEASLKRLNTDYIDLYQIQWPNYEILIEETINALEELKRQGKIKEFGVCNFALEEFKALPTRVRYLQTEFNLQNRIALGYDLDARIIGYNIFNQGFLEPPDYVCDIAAKYGKTPHQIVLSWAVSKGMLMLINTMNLEHLKDDIEATELDLEEADIEKIDNAYISPVEVPVEEIKIAQQKIDLAHKVYTSLDEVIQNASEIHPNPFLLAENIKRYGLLKPVEIKRNGSGYNLIHGSQRYWAWLLAFKNKPIPAFIV